MIDGCHVDAKMDGVNESAYVKRCAQRRTLVAPESVSELDSILTHPALKRMRPSGKRLDRLDGVVIEVETGRIATDGAPERLFCIFDQATVFVRKVQGRDEIEMTDARRRKAVFKKYGGKGWVCTRHRLALPSGRAIGYRGRMGANPRE